MGAGKIQPGKQPAQLLDVDGNNVLGCRGPFETMLFKSLVPQAKTIVVPVQDFDDGALPVAKHKQVAGKRIKIHGLFDQDAKTVDGLAHIGAAHGQVHVAGKARQNHNDCTALSSCLSVGASNPLPTSIL